MEKPVDRIALLGLLVAVAALVMGWVVSMPHASVTDGHLIGNKVRLSIKNTGQSSAYKMTITDVDVHAGSFPPVRAVTALFVKANQPIELKPDQEVTFERAVELPPRNDLVARKAAVYASGVIEFEDYLGGKHHEPFSLIYGGSFGVESTTMGIWTPRK